MDVALVAGAAAGAGALGRAAAVRSAAVDMRKPGTVMVLPSGRRYVVQADGSWRRVRG